jgi:predicted metal-dependent HD superfamily phosphohydrolase
MALPTVLRYPGMAGLVDSDLGGPASRIEVDALAWAHGTVDLPVLDDRIDDLAAAGPFAVAVRGEPAVVVDEVDVRCQRWSGRRNATLPAGDLTRLLRRHRSLHPADKPLVRADYRHALDVWQWVLRLDPEAGGAVQIAALFHDVERIFTEAESRSEQTVSDYDGYKARHAERSAQITERVLEEEGIDSALRARATELIAGHDQPGQAEESEAALLEDADALSYFSLNSSGYLSYYGEEQARRKIGWTFARLSGRGRERLGRLRLPPGVAGLLPTTL